MYCTYMLTLASMKMFLRNRQALFFSLFMPLLILFIFGSMDSSGPGRISLGLVTHSPTPQTTAFLKQIHAFKVFTIDEGTLDSELTALGTGNRTAVLDVPDDLLSAPAGDPPQLTLYANEGRPQEASEAVSILDQFADKAALAAAHAPALFTIKQQSITAHNFRYIEFLLPGVIAMAVMQMSVFSVSFVFAQYREKGVLKRLMATPMRPSQFVTANILTRLVMSAAQASIFIVAGVVCFHVHIQGAIWLLALCVVLGALMFLGLGFTISGLSKSVETVPVLGNIIVFPMLFMGNVFFAASNLPAWLQPIADNLPLTFLAKGLRGVMTDGAGAAQIERSLAGMLIWAVLLITAATVTFRFQDKEG
ncbi:MAG: ABC transporter permease [Tepidisphaeraceae bacterium]|jgi:ABC-2 type transport system permease protein